MATPRKNRLFASRKNIESAHLYTCYVCIHTYTFIHTNTEINTCKKQSLHTRIAQQQQTLLSVCMYLWVTMAALMAQVDSSSCFLFFLFLLLLWLLLLLSPLTSLLLFLEYALSSPSMLFLLFCGLLWLPRFEEVWRITYTHTQTHTNKHARGQKFNWLFSHDICQQHNSPLSLLLPCCQFHFADSVLLNCYWN